jgi:hypothetical protein
MLEFLKNVSPKRCLFCDTPTLKLVPSKVVVSKMGDSQKFRL